jgi:phospholipid-binding lipoprotein MlaA
LEYVLTADGGGGVVRVKIRLDLVGAALNLCLVVGLGGCSMLDSSALATEAAAVRQIPMLDTVDEPSVQGSQPVLETAKRSPTPSRKKPDAKGAAPPVEEDFYDPFAKEDEGVVEEDYDPWEPFNSKIFEFNRQVDKWVLKPVAQGYNFVVPDRLQVGVHNFFYNVRFPPRFFNNLFQGKLKGAGIEVGRFLINSTAGVAGFIDVAERMDVTTPEEDTGQTLGFYGVGPGPYLVVPFLPPFTVRDFVGYFADIALNPINWLVLPIIEVDGVPSAISHPNRDTTTIIQLSTRVGDIVNERSLSLEKFQGVEEATLDLYAAVRNAYLQSRQKQIRQ